MGMLTRLLPLLALLFAAQHCARATQATGPEVADPAQVFRFSEQTAGGHSNVSWAIAPGHYLVKRNMRIIDSEGRSLRPDDWPVAWPAAQLREDPIFGRMETYRDSLQLAFALAPLRDALGAAGAVSKKFAANPGELTLLSQGCNDLGVCFPPQRHRLVLASANAARLNVAQLQLPGLSANKFLPVEQAFPISALVVADEVLLRFDVQPGYYLYKHKFAVALQSASSADEAPVKLAQPILPTGELRQDPYFGEVTVFPSQTDVRIPIERFSAATQEAAIEVSYQGCAEAGLCYPPSKQLLRVDLADLPVRAAPLTESAGTGTAGASGSVAEAQRAKSHSSDHGGKFTTIKSLDDLKRELAAAALDARPVLLDFYADWCAPCKRMEAETFVDSNVQQRFASYVLLRADVTNFDAADSELLSAHQIPGPPAILFFDLTGQELKGSRVVGFTAAPEFVRHLDKIRAELESAGG